MAIEHNVEYAFELVDVRARGDRRETVIGRFRVVERAVDALIRLQDMGYGEAGDYIIREV